MIYNKIFIIIFIFLPVLAHSQKDSSSVKRPVYLLGHNEIMNTLLTGSHFQTGGDTSSTLVNRWFAEVGLHRTSTYYSSHGPVVFTYGFSTLASADKNNKIMGFRTGAWASYFVSMGLSMTYYTNFKQGNFKITPELGFALDRFKLAVGYNIPTFANKDFKAMQDADLQLIVNYLFRIKTIKLTKRW